jgi:hypothetical protein
MGRILNRIDYSFPNTYQKVIRIIESYGATENDSLVGVGNFKEVHLTSVEGVVIVVTDRVKAFATEMENLDILKTYGFKTMKYYTYEIIDGVVIVALAERYDQLDHDEVIDLFPKCNSILRRLVNSGIFCNDLQFLVDGDRSIVLIDPLEVRDINRSDCKICMYYKDGLIVSGTYITIY